MTDLTPPLATILPTSADLDAREDALDARARRLNGVPEDWAPRQRAPRWNAFSPVRQRRFLEVLANGGNVQIACEAMNICRTTVYRLRSSDPMFSRLWDAAMVIARDIVEQTLLQRALDGVEEQVWHGGEMIAVRMRKDPRWMALLLRRMDRVADRPDARDAAAQFQALLDALASPDDIRRHRLDEREAELDEKEARIAAPASTPPAIEPRNPGPPRAFNPNDLPPSSDPIWRV